MSIPGANSEADSRGSVLSPFPGSVYPWHHILSAPASWDTHPLAGCATACSVLYRKQAATASSNRVRHRVSTVCWLRPVYPACPVILAILDTIQRLTPTGLCRCVNPAKMLVLSMKRPSIRSDTIPGAWGRCALILCATGRFPSWACWAL